MKRKAPKTWRDSKMGSIKGAMREMGRTNEDYYHQLATRPKLSPFSSLTELTKANLYQTPLIKPYFQH